MFCNACGANLQASFRVCPNCGKPVTGQPSSPAQGRVARHLKTLAILWMIVGAIWLIPASVMLMLGGVAHLLLPVGDLPRLLGPFVLNVMAGMFLLIAAVGICVGWGLMERRPWARITALVLAVFALFHPPFFTALGIYTLWVLASANSDREYQEITAP